MLNELELRPGSHFNFHFILLFFLCFFLCFFHFILDRFRQNAGNRNKKIATPSKRYNNTSKIKSSGRLKCLTNVINQREKTAGRRNMTKVGNDNSLIDECGNVVEDANNDNEKVVVDFVDEWRHTFAFLSRELLIYDFFLIYF